jgi:hypothetical protein
MKHIAVCCDWRHGRIGFVITAPTPDDCERVADLLENRLGYTGTGCDTLIEAERTAKRLKNSNWGTNPVYGKVHGKS